MPLNPDAVRVGIGPIGWVNDDLRGWGPPYSAEQVMSEIAAAGYIGTEMSYVFPQDPLDLKKAFAGHRLVLAGAYRWTNFTVPGAFDEEVAAAKRHVDFCKAAGAQVANVAEGGGSLHWDLRGEQMAVQPLGDAEWRRLADGLYLVGEYARSQGIRLAVHPHGGTPVESEAEIDRLMRATAPELVGYCLDTGHIYYAGGDPAAVIRRHRHRVAYIHAKDVRANVLRVARTAGLSFKEAVKMNVFCTPGAGCLNWPEIVAALDGYGGWLVVEAEQNPGVYHPLSVAADARKFIRRIAGV